MPDPAATADPPDTAALPATCEIRNWVIFGPGLHKDDLYTPARCRQVVANFAAYSATGHTVPRAALGHDQQQRFARSLGFPSVGRVARCALVPGYEAQGVFEIDVAGVPTEVGGEVGAGRLAGGSVELKSHQKNPADPSTEIPGDLLTGVALLGEEQPAVRNFPPELRERTRPRATFADGSPVPPNPSPARWLEAMAEVTRAMAAEFRGEYLPDRRALRVGGREYSAAAVCFSADLVAPNPGRTMTPEQEAALQAAGFTPEQIAAMKAALPGAAAPAVPPTNPTMSDPAKKPAAMGDLVVTHDDEAQMAAMCKKYADDPAATPEQKMFARMYADMQGMRKEFAEDKKRLGELQAAADAAQKQTAEAQMAAFSADLDARVKALARKVPPVALEALKRQWAALYAPTAKAFSTEADRLRAFSDEVAGYAARPDDPRLAPAPGAATETPSRLSAAGLKVLGAVKDVNPRVYQKHTTATSEK